jgi:predicted nucleic acid-binding protein
MDAVADTSFIVALSDTSDRDHLRCVPVYRGCDVIYLSQSVLAEVGYMLTRIGENQAMVTFIRLLPQSKYRLTALLDSDLIRTADSRVDFVDATLIALAERLNSGNILTLDRRDFGIVRPKHGHFSILPD